MSDVQEDDQPVRQDGIVPGQVWTGRSGMGPNIRLRRFDLEAGIVFYDYLPPYDSKPNGRMSIALLVEHYRLKD